MWNTFLSGAMEAAAGTIVSGSVSSVTSRQEMLDRLDETLFCLNHKVLEYKNIIKAARRRQIIDQELLEWLQAIIQAQQLGDYYVRAFKFNLNSVSSIIESGGENSLSISPYARPFKRIKTLLSGDDMLSALYVVHRKLNSVPLDCFYQLVMGQPEICRPITEYLYMDQTRLFGRDRERAMVMSFLFQTNLAGEGNVDVLAIVGEEGVGKTALVHHCLFDPEVQSHFSKKIYTYGLNKSFSNILADCKGLYNTTYNDENTEVAMLKQNFCSERVLLIFDSLIVEIEPTAWNTLWDCLSCAERGSKIILTFRDERQYRFYLKTCIKFGFVSTINVGAFSEKDFLLFFNEHAFGTVNPKDHPKLAIIGEKIAKKLNGSIWGAKIIGEVLRDNLVPQFWSNLLQLVSLEFQKRKDPWPAVETIVRLLPQHLYLLAMGIGLRKQMHNPTELNRSYRDLMVVGSNLLRPIKDDPNLEVFVVTKSSHLCECTVIIALCHPCEAVFPEKRWGVKWPARSISPFDVHKTHERAEYSHSTIDNLLQCIGGLGVNTGSFSLVISKCLHSRFLGPCLLP